MILEKPQNNSEFEAQHPSFFVLKNYRKNNET